MQLNHKWKPTKRDGFYVALFFLFFSFLCLDNLVVPKVTCKMTGAQPWLECTALRTHNTVFLRAFASDQDRAIQTTKERKDQRSEN
jgi:hypothetical protein